MKQMFPATALRGKSLNALVCSLLGAALAILGSTPAHAMGGGNGSPFSNGTFFPTEGTFQTTIRGVNLSGVATFSTSGSNSTTSGTSSNSTSSGSFTVAYSGLSYTGNMDASIDPAGGNIAATMEASVNRFGSGNATTTLSTSYQLTGTYTTTNGTTTNGTTTNGTTSGGGTYTIPGTTSVTIDNTGNVPPGGISSTTTTAPVILTYPTTNTASTTTPGTTTPGTTTPNYQWVDKLANSSFTDTLYASGSFTASLQNSYPNQIFKGKGSMTFTSIDFSLAPPTLTTTKVNISVKGVRTSNTEQAYTSTTVQAPSVLTTISYKGRTN